MKISDIASRVNFSAILERKDLDCAARATFRKAIDGGYVQRFLASGGDVDEYSKDGVFKLLHRRNDGLARQGRTFDGFTQAIAAVKALREEERVSWLAILTPTDMSIILLRVSTHDVLACLALSRSKNRHVMTPGNWDGSELS